MSANVGPVITGITAETEGADDPVDHRTATDLLSRTVGAHPIARDLTVDATLWQIAGDLVGGDVDIDEGRQRIRRAQEKAMTDAQPQRRRVVTPALLREVASTYREALGQGEPPTAAVAQHFSVSHSTAARYVGQARKAGELGHARGTRPGEETSR